MDERTASLVRECIRQFDNCRYTATALFTWEKRARVWRGMFLVAPIILGGFASSQLLVATGVYGKLIGALCGLLAGFCPAIFMVFQSRAEEDREGGLRFRCRSSSGTGAERPSLTGCPGGRRLPAGQRPVLNHRLSYS
jgi:hypothetical protein